MLGITERGHPCFWCRKEKPQGHQRGGESQPRTHKGCTLRNRISKYKQGDGPFDDAEARGEPVRVVGRLPLALFGSELPYRWSSLRAFAWSCPASCYEREACPWGAVGERVGYRSEAAFSRVFSKLTGATPARYRRDIRNGDAVCII